MPDWYDPLTNTSLAVGLVGFACWFFTRHWWPVHRARIEAETVKNEKEGVLADGLLITQQQQSSLLERQVGMLHDHGIKLGSHGEMLTLHGHRLEEHGKTLAEIREAVRRKREEGSGPLQKGRDGF